MPTAIFGMLMLSLLGAAIWTAISVSGKSADNRWESVSAMQIAEAGAAHALSLLRNELADTTYSKLLLGSDNLPLTSHDGRLTGYGLASSKQIPVSGVTLGGGTYTVRIVDDLADGDTLSFNDLNERVIVRCTGTTPNGGSVTIDAVIGADSSSSAGSPGILVDGPFEISGNPDFLGTCGMVHSNDDLKISGNVTVDVSVTSSQDIDLSGSVEEPDGDPVTPLENQPTIAVPDYSNPTATHCGNWDYNLQANGYILRRSDNTLHDARSTAKFGWKRSGTGPTMWDFSSSTTSYPGTFCVFGNVSMSGNPGESTGVPFSMSIIADGSIEISGNPLLTANDEAGVLLMSKGDVKIGGNPVGAAYNYNGLIYARDQCEISGTPKLNAQIMCKNQTASSGVKDLVSQNKVSGDMALTYNCAGGGGGGGGSGTRRVLSWSQRFN